MRGKTIDILKAAMEGKYAVGAFNVSNMETVQGVVRAAHELNMPCIMQATTNTFKYAGDKVIGDLVNTILESESNSTAIGFHLDHGHSFDDIVRAIDIAGMDSVMIDASQLNLKENITITKRVVDYAHSKGVTVQAELGRVPYLGREDMEINWDEVMTNPEDAKKLVEETGIDALAVGIGNAHGFFRERNEMDWERLEKIKSLVPNIPLIIHGASDWKEDNVKKAVERGVCCFNVDTDIRVAFMTAICHRMSEKCDIADARKILGEAREAVVKKVTEKIKMFRGSL